MRLLATLLFVTMIAIAFGERLAGGARGDAINIGERAGLQRCRELHAAYLRHVEASGERRHPGLAPLAADVPGLSPLPIDGSAEGRSYAVGEHYMYGIYTREIRQPDGSLVDDYVLRAWPLAFGRTGDVEYVLQDGQLWIGANRIGRSGAEFGFPPVFPEPDIGQPKVPWRRVDLVATGDE